MTCEKLINLSVCVIIAIIKNNLEVFEMIENFLESLKKSSVEIFHS